MAVPVYLTRGERYGSYARIGHFMRARLAQVVAQKQGKSFWVAKPQAENVHGQK